MKYWLTFLIITTPIIDYFGNNVLNTQQLSSFQIFRGLMMLLGILLLVKNRNIVFLKLNWFFFILIVYHLISTIFELGTLNNNLISSFHLIFLIVVTLISSTLIYNEKLTLSELKFSLGYMIIIFFIMQVYAIISGVYYKNAYDAQFILVGSEGSTSVTSEIIVSCLPLFMYDFFKNKKYVIPLIITFLTIGLLRRTSILILITIILLGFFKIKSTKYKYLSLIILTLALILIVTQTPIMSDLLLRFKDTSGSGRTTLLPAALELFGKYDISDFMFGKPGDFWEYTKWKFGATMGAHNDFIDFMLNKGLLGLIIFISFNIFILKQIKHIKILNEEFNIIYYGSILYLLFTENLSGTGTFTPKNFIFFILISLVLSTIKKQQKALLRHG